MLIHIPRHGFDHATPSDITPRAIYEQRRDLIKLLAGGAAGAVLAGWAARDAMAQTPRPGKLAALPGARSAVAGAVTMEWAWLWYMAYMLCFSANFPRRAQASCPISLVIPFAPKTFAAVNA